MSELRHLREEEQEMGLCLPWPQACTPRRAPSCPVLFVSLCLSRPHSAFPLFCLRLGLHDSTVGPFLVLFSLDLLFLSWPLSNQDLLFPSCFFSCHFPPSLFLCLFLCLDSSASFAPPAGFVRVCAPEPVCSGCALPLHNGCIGAHHICDGV